MAIVKRRQGHDRTTIEHFHADNFFRIDPSGCWIWNASTRPKSNGSEYGTATFKGKLRYAHRIFMFLARSIPLEGEFEARHSCHNSLCVNPDHLIIGTHLDNMRDMMAAKRARCRNGHEINHSRGICETCLKMKVDLYKAGRLDLREQSSIYRDLIRKEAS